MNVRVVQMYIHTSLDLMLLYSFFLFQEIQLETPSEQLYFYDCL